MMIVMAGLDPAIHVFLSYSDKVVDARVKPGHDEPFFKRLVGFHSPASS